jgi:hypothetical protein
VKNGAPIGGAVLCLRPDVVCHLKGSHPHWSAICL